MTNYDNQGIQLFIAKGRNDGMDEQSLVDFVSAETNIDPQSIGKVKILEAFSFFAVPADDVEIILSHFQKKAGEGRPLVSKAKRKTENRSGGYDRRDDRRSEGRRDFGGNSNGGNGYRGNSDRRDDRRSDDRRRDNFGNSSNGNSFNGSNNSRRKTYND
jgi:ATP-dependent RNA helicase DeaD